MIRSKTLHLLVLWCATGEDPSARRIVLQLEPTVSGGSMPRRLTHPDNSYSAHLGNYDNVQYNVQIQVGQPCGNSTQIQEFNVVPDTGSSDLWIPAANCSLCKPDSAHFDLHASCSAVPLGDRVRFKYGDGTTAEGISFRDVVTIGGLEVEHQYMIQVDKMDSSTHMKSDGILGLAHHYKEDEEKTHTFMSTLFREHPELPHQFSFFLTGVSSDTSSLVFGDADLPRHSKEDAFHYGKAYYMSSTDLWLTSVWSIGWSNTGTSYSFPDRGTLGAPALIDSGSSLIVLSPEIYDRIIEDLQRRLLNCRTLPEQSILMCDCPEQRFLERIPHLVINIIDEQDQQYGLCMSPDEFILQSTDPFDGRTTCVPAIQKGSANQPVPLILGMTFMRSFYTNFDVENHRIGFARSINSPLSANAVCPIYSQPAVRRALWWASVVMAFSSVCFCMYVFLVPRGWSAKRTIRPDTEQPLGANDGSPTNT